MGLVWSNASAVRQYTGGSLAILTIRNNGLMSGRQAKVVGELLDWQMFALQTAIVGSE